ncbi:MAG TPA: high-potential iron-sulfur protein [Steroidobacteraceae bacterium]
MTQSVSRRDALKQVVLLLGAAAAVRPGQSAHAAEDLPHLDPSDPTAKSLGYHSDSKSVDAKAFPMYKAGSACNNCLQFRGTPGQAWGPCNIFAGKAVNANGWCQVYVKKA